MQLQPVEVMTRVAVGLLIERPGRAQNWDQHTSALRTNGEKLAQRLSRLSDTEANRAQLRHIIGLERWGQRRLRSLLGEARLDDEMDGYCPAESLDFAALRSEFEQTRAATIALAQALAQANCDDSQLLRHNQFGLLSPRGWLRYLDQHAYFESYRLK